MTENRVATLKDVAALAGVGMSTASRAISGKGPISADAAARVQAAIEALNFRPVVDRPRAWRRSRSA